MAIPIKPQDISELEVERTFDVSEVPSLEIKMNQNATHFEDSITPVLNKLMNTSSSIDKLAILEKNKDNPYLSKYLHYVYNPNWVYNMKKLPEYHTQVRIKTKLGANEDVLYASKEVSAGNLSLTSVTGFKLFTDLFDKLQGGLRGNAASDYYVDIATRFDLASQYLIDKCLLRDVGCGLGVTLINKVWPGLIFTFDVALAKQYTEKYAYVVKFDGSIYASCKKDGLRCVYIHNGSEYKPYTRTGKEILTLGNVTREITRLTRGITPKPVFDGEICIVDDNGMENFSDIAKEWNKKNHTIHKPKYLIFDCLTLEEFGEKESTRILTQRWDYLKELFITNPDYYTYLDILEQTKLESLEQFAQLQQEARDKNWEGLILRVNTTYKGRRSHEMLKIKEMSDAEFEIVDVECGSMTYQEKTGTVNYDNVVTNVIIEYKGNKVSVGSGFTRDQRIEFAKDPSTLIGQIATIQWFEETVNSKTNLVSLRHPVLKTLHGKKREA